MAKLKGKAKAAFLRRMAAGRAKARRPRSNSNPVAYVVNPGAAMAANPKRKRRKHRKHRRASNPISYSNARRRRRRRHANPISYSNARRRRRRHRRNPGMPAGLRKVGAVAIPAIAGGFVANFVEAKLAGRGGPIVAILTKAGLAVGAGAVLRKNPAAACAAMGAILGSIGSAWGTRAGGGLVAPSAKAGMKELAEMVAENGELALVMKEELSGYGLGLVMAENMGEEEDGLGGTSDAAIDAAMAEDDDV